MYAIYQLDVETGEILRRVAIVASRKAAEWGVWELTRRNLDGLYVCRPA